MTHVQKINKKSVFNIKLRSNNEKHTTDKKKSSYNKVEK